MWDFHSHMYTQKIVGCNQNLIGLPILEKMILGKGVGGGSVGGGGCVFSVVEFGFQPWVNTTHAHCYYTKRGEILRK